VERLLTLRVALIVLAGILATFGVTNGWVAIFWQSKYEVSYQFDVSVTYCFHQQCAFSGTLKVANTGRREQDEVVVSMTGVPANTGSTPRVTNLSAAEPREADPKIEQNQNKDTYVIRLRGLKPGALTLFHFQGQIPASEAAKAQEPIISVSGRGRMIEGDPRAIAFGRFF